MMYAMIIFAKVVSKTAGISDNDETLTERIVLKSFDSLFRDLKLFTVSKRLQVSGRYAVNEFLHRKNKIAIESGIEDSGDHDGDDIDLK